MDFIAPLKTSLASDSSDSDRCDNDSGKELKTIKLCNQKEKFIQCKSGVVSLACQSDSTAAPPKWDLIPQSELRTARSVATLRQDGERAQLRMKKQNMLKSGICTFETIHKTQFPFAFFFFFKLAFCCCFFNC